VAPIEFLTDPRTVAIAGICWSKERPMIATLRPLTYADLHDMPHDGNRYEVIGGQLIVHPVPT
jgi:hypothetical protein